MEKTLTISPHRKTLPAYVAALSMTAFIGLVFLAFGLNALLNRNTTVTLSAPKPDTQVSADQATIQGLQAAITLYQTRETQYQNELKQAADQINQIGQQNQQYQQLIQALVNAGVIQITQDGRVFISRGAGLQSGSGGDGN